MEADLIFVVVVVGLAFFFDFTNGFHDSSNSIATIVSTGVLSPTQSVLWAAFFNFIAFIIFKLSVASTIGIGLIDTSVVNTYFIFAALLSAIMWNLITWYFGFPSSSSHALIGGLVGAGIMVGGISTIVLSGLFKVIIAIFLSPFLGLVLGFGLNKLIIRITKNINQTLSERLFKHMQLFSSACLSLAHGGNDAQKTMGVIAVLLYTNSLIGEKFYVPFWVVIACYFMIALGTLSAGWRIVHTMGKKITALNPMRGCCAETSSAAVIITATTFGVPISTTHAVNGSIAGVGITESKLGTNWIVMRKIFITWIVTMPITAVLSAMIMLIYIYVSGSIFTS